MAGEITIRPKDGLTALRDDVVLAMVSARDRALALDGEGPFLNLGWSRPADSEEQTGRASEAIQRVVVGTIIKAQAVVNVFHAFRHAGFLPFEEFLEFAAAAASYGQSDEWTDPVRVPRHAGETAAGLFWYARIARVKPNLAGYLAYLEEMAPLAWQLLNDTPDFLLPMGLRRDHTYVTAGSGRGKSELMKALVYEHVHHPQTGAVVILDVHGKFGSEVAHWPKVHEEPGRLVFLDPRLFGGDRVLCVNPFDVPAGVDLWEYAEGLALTLEETLGETRSLIQQETLKHCAYGLLMAGGKDLRDLLALLEDDAATLDVVSAALADDQAGHFFASPILYRAKARQATKEALAFRLNGLLSGPGFALFCGPSSIQLEPLLTPGRVIVCNVGRSQTGLRLGRFLLSTMEAIALKRADGRRFTPVHVFVDECQNFLSRSTIGTLLNEARKFGFHMTLAQQVAGGKVADSDIEDALYNNCSLKFTGGTEYDKRAAALAGRKLDELRSLKRGQFYVSTEGNPSVLITVREDLADGRRSVDGVTWKDACEAQRRWYKLPEPLRRPAAPAAADEGPEAAASSPGRRRVTTDPQAARDAATHVPDLI